MNERRIASYTRQEQTELLDVLGNLIRQGASFTQRVIYGNVAYTYYADIFEIINGQYDLIESARQLCLGGRYRAAFITIRAVLEHYLAVRLIGQAKRYALRIKKPKREKTTAALSRLKEEALQARAQGRKDILGVRTFNNGLYVVFDGPFANGKRSKEARTSYYYGVLKNFDPDLAYLPRTILGRHWYWDKQQAREDDIRLQSEREFHRNLKQDFMGVDRLLFHNRINRFLTADQEGRVRVHYNFLSHFVHPTKQSAEVFRKDWAYTPYIERLSDIRSYNFFISHLILLYLSFFSLMYGELQHNVVNQASRKYMRGVRSREALDKCRATLLDQFGYFWFIYHGKPHGILKYNQLARQVESNRPPTVTDYRLVPDNKVKYYTDPLQHLHDLAGAWTNRILGSVEGPLIGKGSNLID